jgi:hypothetical protein
MTEQAITMGRLVPSLGNGNEDTEREVIVHFNPVSLQYTVTNTMEESKGNDKKQYVSKSVGKLTMDLIFDTTHNGEDVRGYTEKIARFLEPDEKKAPPVILFEWGKYKFQGMVESFKETIDFFAASGVPLRSSVNLTMSRQDKVFEPSDTSGTADVAGSPAFDTVELPGGGNQDATAVATRGGNSRAGRAVAAANGFESMRFSSGAITVGGAVSLRGPVAFASGGAGISAGASLGIGLGVSGEVSVSGGTGVGSAGTAGIGSGVSGGASASAGLEVSATVGGRASAGVAASAGAFSSLRLSAASRRTASVSLETRRLVRQGQSAPFSTSARASFGIGGQARVQGSASLSADVGQGASLRNRIAFDGE